MANKDDLQEGVDKIIKGHGGKPVGSTGKKYDMSKEVEKEKEKGDPKGKSK